jgi:hypothetical protein
MRVEAGSSEDEMIAVFLQAELRSERFGAELAQLLAHDRRDHAIVAAPDLREPAANAYRRRLLGAFRGYGRDERLFEGFPADVQWEWVALTPGELFQVRYIDYSYWNALSGGSRLPRDAAPFIRAGGLVFGTMDTSGFLHIAEALRKGAKFPPLILVRAGETAPLVLLEGHVRLTAYALAPERVPAELPVLLGTSPGFLRWGCY